MTLFIFTVLIFLAGFIASGYLRLLKGMNETGATLIGGLALL